MSVSNAEMGMVNDSYINQQDSNGMNILMLAVQNDEYDLVRILTRFRTIDLELKNMLGETALHIAIRKGNFRMQRLLIGAGANMNARIGDDGPSALSCVLSLLREDDGEIVIR